MVCYISNLTCWVWKHLVVHHVFLSHLRTESTISILVRFSVILQLNLDCWMYFRNFHWFQVLQETIWSQWHVYPCSFFSKSNLLLLQEIHLLFKQLHTKAASFLSLWRPKVSNRASCPCLLTNVCGKMRVNVQQQPPQQSSAQ